MRYPIFKQWLVELSACKEKSKNSLILTTKTATIGNQIIRITLGKGRLDITQNGIVMWAKELRPDYTRHKREFNTLLDEIKLATDSIADASNEILNIVTQAQVPEVILKRMKGEEVEADGASLVKSTTEANLDLLLEMLGKAPKNIGNIAVEVPDVAGETLNIETWHDNKITWGPIYKERYRSEVGDLESCFRFNQNLPLIKGKVTKFCRLVDELANL